MVSATGALLLPPALPFPPLLHPAASSAAAAAATPGFHRLRADSFLVRGRRSGPAHNWFHRGSVGGCRRPEEIEITSVRGLQDVQRVQSRPASEMGARRRRPGGPAAIELPGADPEPERGGGPA